MSKQKKVPEKGDKDEKQRPEDRRETDEDTAETEKNAKSEALEPHFIHLIETFAVQAMIYLGKIINPISNRYEKDLAMARYQIGILEILGAKTKGNLSPEEEKLLEELLHTTRRAYIDVAAEGKSEPPDDKAEPEKKPS
jgi:hypothetical protein